MMIASNPLGQFTYGLCSEFEGLNCNFINFNNHVSNSYNQFHHRQQLIGRKRKMNNLLMMGLNDDEEFYGYCQILNKKTKIVNTTPYYSLVCGSFYLPKDNKQRPKGEDAHFVCQDKQTVGVADGVGGWASKGVDAGEYARELMNNAFISVNNSHNNNQQQKIDGTDDAVDPRKVLNEAYESTKKNLGLKGSSTACILTVDKHTGILRAANVGDSGFMLFRNSKMVYQSPIQQHTFNHPYQLGNDVVRCDGPEKAEEIKVETMAGDVVVVGTDGLLDNMFPSEIEDVLGRQQHMNGVNELASMIANLALYNSFDRFSATPFSENANKAELKYKGGKIDDITVIVARVS